MAASAGKTLKIEDLQLAQSDDGTPVAADFQYLPGDMVFFSCRLTGYARQGDDPPKFSLTYEVEVRDSKGLLILTPETGKLAGALSPEDKHWRPKIRFMISLPPLADTGQYPVLVKVKDEFGKDEAEATIPILVRGRDVEPSDTLVVRNFRFLRSEEDRNPLSDPAYRPGDSVWARFDMTGYKLGDKNSLDIEYGLKVLRPGGDLAYDKPHAADAKNEFFYPQRYTPGIMSVNLPKDLDKGQYTIILTVHDNIGKQDYQMQRKFSVE